MNQVSPTIVLIAVLVAGCASETVVVEPPFTLSINLQEIPSEEDESKVHAFLESAGFEGFGSQWSQEGLTWKQVIDTREGLLAIQTPEGVRILGLVEESARGEANMSFAAATSTGEGEGHFKIRIRIEPSTAEMFVETNVPGLDSGGPFTGSFEHTLDLKDADQRRFFKRADYIAYRVEHAGTTRRYHFDMNRQVSELQPEASQNRVAGAEALSNRQDSSSAPSAIQESTGEEDPEGLAGEPEEPELTGRQPKEDFWR